MEKLFRSILDKDDTNADDLIDVLLPGIENARISGSWTNWTIRGNYNRTLELNWRVQCNENYYGDCTVYCLPKDSDIDGHYICNSTTGAKICRSGWTGNGSYCHVITNTQGLFTKTKRTVQRPQDVCRSDGCPSKLLYTAFLVKKATWSFGVVLWEIFTLGCFPYP
ncbi:uncharacterized protein [Oscarella lobularis]|uniref:uncharacterized protein isoform X2 n=1 Tax=Oscarella lobularis TaxID=121494 RepID=UPI0033143BF3